jgi:hypothetical protein
VTLVLNIELVLASRWFFLIGGSAHVIRHGDVIR